MKLSKIFQVLKSFTQIVLFWGGDVLKKPLGRGCGIEKLSNGWVGVKPGSH